jgi:hypothetical protein
MSTGSFTPFLLAAIDKELWIVLSSILHIFFNSFIRPCPVLFEGYDKDVKSFPSQKLEAPLAFWYQ